MLHLSWCCDIPATHSDDKLTEGGRRGVRCEVRGVREEVEGTEEGAEEEEEWRSEGVKELHLWSDRETLTWQVREKLHIFMFKSINQCLMFQSPLNHNFWGICSHEIPPFKDFFLHFNACFPLLQGPTKILRTCQRKMLTESLDCCQFLLRLVQRYGWHWCSVNRFCDSKLWQPVWNPFVTSQVFRLYTQSRADPRYNKSEHKKPGSEMAHTKSKHDQPEQTPHHKSGFGAFFFNTGGHGR